MRCTTNAFVEWYATTICKFRYVVLAFWILLAGGSAFFIMKFVSNTSQEFSPPSGTQAADAEDAMALDFPAMSSVSYMNVFIQLSTAAAAASSAPVFSYPSVFQFVNATTNRFTKAFGNSIAQMPNYYDLVLLGMNEEAAQLVSSDGTAMVLPLMLKADFVSKAAEDFGDTMKKIVKEESYIFDGNATAACNGIPIFVEGIVKNAQEELGVMDAVAIPLAMIIMSITLKSVRMMILPLLTIGFTLAISFGAMYFVSMEMVVSSTTPSLMMSLCIAMSIDYNLFILSRYKEELHKGMRDVNCVANVLRTAGHTILISGVTLLFCLLSLIFFPLNLLQSFGVGCGFSIIVSLLISLSFAPAVLFTFPSFFEGSIRPTAFPTWFPVKIAEFLNSGGYTYDDYVSSSDKNVPKGEATTAAGGAEEVFLATDRGASNTNFTPRKETLDSNVSSPALALATNSSPSLGNSLLRGEKQRLLSSGEVSMRTDSTIHSGRHFQEPNLKPEISTSLDAQYYHRTQSWFYRLHVVLRFPINLIVFLVLIGITLAFGYAVLSFKTTDSFESYLPRGSDVMNDFAAFVAKFGFGYTQPYHILLSGRGGVPLDSNNAAAIPDAHSEAFFVYFQGFLKALVADHSVATTNVSNFVGLFTLGGTWVNYSQVAPCFSKNPLVVALQCNANFLGLLDMVSNTSATPSAMYVILINEFDPMGNLGDPFYKNIMALATRYHDAVVAAPATYAAATNTTAEELLAVASYYRLYFAGVGPDSMDAIDTIYRLFPIIIGVSGGAVLLVVGIAFRSVVMPLRSVISIGATQLFVFGLAVLTYQSPGIFNWTSWGSLTSFGAVSWTAPIVAFPVIVGVALDYDIFLLTRIVELVQEESLSTTDAVLHALCSTGRIITSAGIIMAVAFFGLILSKTQILNLLGFFMVAAVLFDTFIVRTLLVPTLMSLLGKWNWFPRRLDTSEEKHS